MLKSEPYSRPKYTIFETLFLDPNPSVYPTTFSEKKKENKKEITLLCKNDAASYTGYEKNGKSIRSTESMSKTCSTKQQC